MRDILGELGVFLSTEASRNFFGKLSAGIALLALWPYVKYIIRGVTRPSRVSWIIWTITNVLIAVAAYSKKELTPLMEAAVGGNLIVLALCIPYGKPGWSRIDKFSLIASGTGVALWFLFGDALLGMLAGLSAMTIASLPTFEMAWKWPERESKAAWTFVWVGSLVSVLGAKSWTVMGFAQPLTYVGLESTMMYLLFVRPRYRRKIQSDLQGQQA